MMKPKIIVGIVLGVLFIIFLLQNTQVISIRLLFWKLSMSRIIFLPLILLLGFVIGFFIGRQSKK